MPPRRLEVLVVSARGFGDTGKDDNLCRREVELAVVSHLDSEGEKFGLKTSAWAVPGSAGASEAHFGKSGLRTFFPLAGRHAPDYVNDKRFKGSAELRIRLYASGMSTNSPSLLLAKSLLPTSMATSAAKALDKATAWIEAETRVSLEEMLASEPDSHISGWRKLHRVQMTGATLDLKPIEVWVQAFVLPDAEKHIRQLNEDYRAMGAKIPNFRANGCNWIPADGPWKSKQQAPPPVVSSLAASSSEAPRPNMNPTPPAVQPAPAQPRMAVVPPGVQPGMLFVVMDVPLQHRVQCPSSMKGGDSWKFTSPVTGVCLDVTIPLGVEPGSFFAAEEQNFTHMECPQGATPGSLVEFKPLKLTSNVVCPADKKPGDFMLVYVEPVKSAVNVQIPAGVAPGDSFAFTVVPGVPQSNPEPGGSAQNSSTEVPLGSPRAQEVSASVDLLSMPPPSAGDVERAVAVTVPLDLLGDTDALPTSDAHPYAATFPEKSLPAWTSTEEEVNFTCLEEKKPIEEGKPATFERYI
jgi:hypothetical protein